MPMPMWLLIDMSPLSITIEGDIENRVTHNQTHFHIEC